MDDYQRRCADERFFPVAHDGARVRVAARFASATRLTTIAESPARSLIVLTDSIATAQAARLGIELTGGVKIPALVTTTVPQWVGPLDAVVCTCRNDPQRAAHMIRDAIDAGSEVFVAGSPDLLEDISVRATPIEMPVSAPEITPVFVAALTCSALGALCGASGSIARRLQIAADAIDTELARCSPDRDPLVNPAAELRLYLETHTPVFTGSGTIPLMLAQAAATLLADAGVPCVALEPVAAARCSVASGPRDIFADPEAHEGTRMPVGIVGWMDPPAGVDCRPEYPADDCVDHTAAALTLLARAAATAVYDPSVVGPLD